MDRHAGLLLTYIVLICCITVSCISEARFIHLHSPHTASTHTVAADAPIAAYRTYINQPETELSFLTTPKNFVPTAGDYLKVFIDLKNSFVVTDDGDCYKATDSRTDEDYLRVVVKEDEGSSPKRWVTACTGKIMTDKDIDARIVYSLNAGGLSEEVQHVITRPITIKMVNTPSFTSYFPDHPQPHPPNVTGLLRLFFNIGLNTPDSFHMILRNLPDVDMCIYTHGSAQLRYVLTSHDKGGVILSFDSFNQRSPMDTKTDNVLTILCRTLMVYSPDQEDNDEDGTQIQTHQQSVLDSQSSSSSSSSANEEAVLTMMKSLIRSTGLSKPLYSRVVYPESWFRSGGDFPDQRGQGQQPPSTATAPPNDVSLHRLQQLQSSMRNKGSYVIQMSQLAKIDIDLFDEISYPLQILPVKIASTNSFVMVSTLEPNHVRCELPLPSCPFGLLISNTDPDDGDGDGDDDDKDDGEKKDGAGNNNVEMDIHIHSRQHPKQVAARDPIKISEGDALMVISQSQIFNELTVCTVIDDNKETISDVPVNIYVHPHDKLSLIIEFTFLKAFTIVQGASILCESATLTGKTPSLPRSTFPDMSALLTTRASGMFSSAGLLEHSLSDPKLASTMSIKLTAYRSQHPSHAYHSDGVYVADIGLATTRRLIANFNAQNPSFESIRGIKMMLTDIEYKTTTTAPQEDYVECTFTYFSVLSGKAFIDYITEMAAEYDEDLVPLYSKRLEIRAQSAMIPISSYNQLLDHVETDVDCGGQHPSVARCQPSYSCHVDTDCVFERCSSTLDVQTALGQMKYSSTWLFAGFLWIASLTAASSQSTPYWGYSLSSSLEYTPPESCAQPFVKVPLFKGNLDADMDGHSTHSMQSIPYSPLQHGGGGDSDYADDTKWSIYPQHSENAHIIIGMLTLAQLYIWLCNVIGRFTFSKALIVGGTVQCLQGIYLLFFLFYVYAPHDLATLHEYVLNDLVELQHCAISTSLLTVGLLDIILGIVLECNCFLFLRNHHVHTTTRSVGRPTDIPKNNLLFYSRYLHIFGFIAQALNGLQFITHPQHSSDNDFGHFLLGMSLIIGAFTLLVMRLLHQSWQYFSHLIQPRQEQIDTIMASTNDDYLRYNDRNELVISGSKYNLSQLSDLHILSGGDRQQQEQMQSSSSASSAPQHQSTDIRNEEHAPTHSNRRLNPTTEMAKHHAQWNTGLTDCMYSLKRYQPPDTKEHAEPVQRHSITFPEESGCFDWNRQWVRQSRFLNFLVNCLYYIYYKLYQTKTRRQIIVGLSFVLCSVAFLTAALILVTFKEPPTEVHMSHYYKCFSQYGLVVFAVWVNVLLLLASAAYVVASVLHYYGYLAIPSIYEIKIFQQAKIPF